MEEELYKHEDVQACEFKAKRIVTDLFNAYLGCENLIHRHYLEACNDSYRDLGVKDEHTLLLIAVRNYVAGMTDAFAIDQHARLFMSSERVRFA